MATLKLASLMASTSTKSKAKTSSICFCMYVVSVITFPKWSTSANTKFSLAANSKTSAPSAAFKNSPFSFNSFKAFHCLGLWLAVKIIPPQAPSFVTANSVVGVVDKSMSTTSNPIPVNVPKTTCLTIGPEIRASLPTTILLDATFVFLRMNVAYAATNFTMANGFKPSSGVPPIVPRIPEIDLISVIYIALN